MATTAWFNAARIGDIQTIHSIFRENPVLIDQKDLCAENEDINAVERLFKEKPVWIDDVDPNDDDWHWKGRTGLHYAAANGHTEIARVLVQSGAAVNVQDDRKNTPLVCAAMYGHENVMIFLIQEANAAVNIPNWKSEVALHWAAYWGKENSTKAMIAADACLDMQNQDQKTALTIATERGHSCIVDFIAQTQQAVVIFASCGASCAGDEQKVEAAVRWALKVKGAAFFCGQNEFALSALLKTCEKDLQAGQSETVYDILQTIGLEAKSDTGKTLLMLAGERNLINVAEYLIQHDAQAETCFVNSWTALMFAANAGHLELVKLLYNNKANVNKRSITDETALMLASRQSHEEVAFFLIECDADLSAKSALGCTALIEASRTGNLKIVERLMKCGSNCEDTDMYGWTALLHASWEGQIDVARFLVEKGANINATNDMKNTPLMLAAVKGRHELVRFLVEKGADVTMQNLSGLTAQMQINQIAAEEDRHRLDGFGVGDSIELCENTDTGRELGRVISVRRLYDVAISEGLVKQVQSHQVYENKANVTDRETIRAILKQGFAEEEVESQVVSLASRLTSLAMTFETNIKESSVAQALSDLNHVAQTVNALQKCLELTYTTGEEDSKEESEPAQEIQSSAPEEIQELAEAFCKEVHTISITKARLVTNLTKKPIKISALPSAISSSKLRALEISRCTVIGEFPIQILQYATLEKLLLSGNMFKGTIPNSIGEQLPNIVELCLSNNGFSGTIPESLGKLKRCEVLDLSKNLLTGSIPTALGNAVKLRWLLLQKNLLSGELTREFAKSLCHLKKLNLCGNQGLSGSIPDSFLEITGLDLNVNDTGIKGAAVSLAVPQFPLHVVPREALLKMRRMCTHEKAGIMCRADQQDPEKGWRQDGIVLCLKPNADGTLNSWTSVHDERIVVTRKQLAYLSQRWWSPNENPELSHPDDAENTKLAHIQQLAIDNPHWKFFWIDFMCTPQAPERSEEKLLAIKSLPHFVKCCSAMITLCGNSGEATLDVYWSRGWCRLEQLSSIAPLYCKGCYGEHFLCNTSRYIANKDDHTFKEMTDLSTSDIDPLKGYFVDDQLSKPVNEKDRSKVALAVKAVCECMLDDLCLQGTAKMILDSANAQLQKMSRPADEAVSTPRLVVDVEVQNFKTGDKVLASWKGGKVLYPATILGMTTEGRYNVRYVDGHSDLDVDPKHVHPRQDLIVDSNTSSPLRIRAKIEEARLLDQQLSTSTSPS